MEIFMIIYYKNIKLIIYFFIVPFCFCLISKNIYSQPNNKNQKNFSTTNTVLNLKWLKHNQTGGNHGSSNFHLYDSFDSSLPSGFSNSNFSLWGFPRVKEKTPDVYFIKGFIKDSSGTSISDVIVYLYLSGDSADTDTTSYDGNYEFTSLVSGKYKVKPKKSDWSFKPSEINYNPLNSNQTDQDFKGLPDNNRIVDNYDNLPRKYQLYQNHPNPFNPITQITFDLPKKEHVTVKIFDLRGSELIMLFDGIKQAGHYELIWNGKDRFGNNVTSGVYFYKINAGQFYQIRKMVLIR